MTVSRELYKYKSDLVGVQVVRWEGYGTEPAGEYTFFYRKENENHELGTGFFVFLKSVQLSSLVTSFEYFYTHFPKPLRILHSDD
jgi:hypothetical protein